MEKRKLTRSRDNRVVGGVAAGLANYLNIDPVIVRVLFVFLAFCGGSGLILYIVLLFVMPESMEGDYEPHTIDPDPIIIDQDGNAVFQSDEEASKDKEEKRDIKYSRKQNGVTGGVIGIILIAFGVFILLSKFFAFNWSQFVIPSALILAGILLIILSNKSKKQEHA